MEHAPSKTASTTVPAGAIAQYVHAHEDAYIDFLARLVRAESPSTDPTAQAEAQHLLADAMADLGFHVTHLPGTKTGGALYARPAHRSRGTPCQLLLGHSDTVWPLGTLDEMPVRRKENMLRGPGAFDMKAGLTSIVFALRTLHALDLSPALCPLVLITTDEEIGSFESKPHIERLGGLSNRVFVAEPALGLEGNLKTARKGTGEMTLTVRPTDASGEDQVVLEMSNLVQRLHALADAERGITINVGKIEGHRKDRPTGRAYGRMAVDVRVVTREDARIIGETIRGIEATSPGVTVEVSGAVDRPPLERTSGNRYLWRQAQALGHHLGLELNEARAGGASDGNLTSPYTATLDGLGAVGDGAHAEHEFIYVDQTLDRCALLASLLLAPPREEGAVPQDTH
jgi:glutamate carboxypeptidase